MLDGYVSEKEQLESIKKWWDNNGKFIAIAIIIGLLLGFAWRYWHQMQLRLDDNASMLYQSVVVADAKNNFKTAQGGAAILMKNFANTPYASLAALLSAKEWAEQKQYDQAMTQYQWVITHSNVTRLQQIARISAASLLLTRNQPDAALKIISVVNDKHFEPLIAWVKGDIDMQKGDIKNARKNYQIAKNALAPFPPAANYLSQLMSSN